MRRTETDTRPGRLIPVLGWLLLAVAIADWVALRRGLAPNPPSVLAVLVAVTVLAFVARVAQIGWRVSGGRARWPAAIAESAVILGVVVALTAGTVNWLLSLQGFVILQEGENVGAFAVGGGNSADEIVGALVRLDQRINGTDDLFIKFAKGIVHGKATFTLGAPVRPMRHVASVE